MSARFQWALECISLSHDDSFLEIGPGTGALLMLAREISRGPLYAVESSATMFAKAASRMKEIDNVKLIHGDFRTADLALIRVTKALAFNVNIFVKMRDQTAFNRLAECVRSGGNAGIFCQNPPGSSRSDLNQMLSIIAEGFQKHGFVDLKYHELKADSPTGGVVATRS